MPRKPQIISCIYSIDLSETIIWKYVSDSCVDLLGYEPSELIGTSPVDLIHPDEQEVARGLRIPTIMGDKAAIIAYLHLRHKNPEIGYVLIAASRTVVEDIMIGSLTRAVPGAGTMHTIATATEVNIVAPEALEFVFHKWVSEPELETPTPKAAQSVGASDPEAPNASSSAHISALLNPEPEQDSLVSPSNPETQPPSESLPPQPPFPKLSSRQAVVLDRFSRSMTISYMSNTRILPPVAQGRSFFDFVRTRDERLVRAWLEAVKGWDAGAGGPGAGGGFGYGRFGLVLAGRNSRHRRKESGSRQRSEIDEGIISATSQSGDVGRVQKMSVARATRERRTASVGGQRRPDPDPDVLIVDGIFSAHSDGLLVILKRVEDAA